MDQAKAELPHPDEAPDPNIKPGSPEWEADFERRMDLGRERRARILAEEMAKLGIA